MSGQSSEQLLGEWTLTPHEVMRAAKLIRGLKLRAIKLEPEGEAEKFLFVELPRKLHNSCLVTDNHRLLEGCKLGFESLRKLVNGEQTDFMDRESIDNLLRVMAKVKPAVPNRNMNVFAQGIVPAFSVAVAESTVAGAAVAIDAKEKLLHELASTVAAGVGSWTPATRVTP